MSEHSKSFKLSRRTAAAGFATATGSLILKSLATGIPASVLLDPLSANADNSPSGKQRTLIMSCSRAGDPFNNNVPGTYGITGVPTDKQPVHPPDEDMTATPMRLLDTDTVAAKPWADLPQHVLDKTAFFHHATHTPVHGEMQRVHRMMDTTEKNDMLISLIGRETAAGLGCVQAEPVSLGATNGTELLSSEGRILGNVACTAVRAALGGVEGPLGALTALRDTHIDEIYALYKRDGTPSQRRLLESWTRSRNEVRNIKQDLISLLEEVDGNGPVNQLRTAAILAAMNIAPVITVRLDFGRDNHTDPDLENETAGHLASIAGIKTLQETLATLKNDGILKQEVLFASLNVFGRTFFKKGTRGRDHNRDHHCLMMMGDGIRGGIVGGIALSDPPNEYIARGIDSASGAADDNGDIAFQDSLGAAGKTLGCVLGVSEERMNEIIPSGKAVQSVIV